MLWGAVPATEIENAAGLRHHKLLARAAVKRTLAQPDHPQLQRIRVVAQRLIPQASRRDERAAKWNRQVNLILDQLKLTGDAVAMVMGHEMANSLREHARARMAKGALTSVGA